MILIIWTIIFLLVLAVVFVCGRRYERKQFVHIGKKTAKHAGHTAWGKR